MIQHFTSLDYLKALVPMADELIAIANGYLDERSPLDPYGIALGKYNQTSTAAHFSTHAFPALVSFRDGLLESIVLREYERYRICGEYECARMLEEYAGPMTWATAEQEAAFKKRFWEIYAVASKVSAQISRNSAFDDYCFSEQWREGIVDRTRVPKFKVRTDIMSRSGERPPRTGLYVPKDDPMGVVQLAWTGGYGELKKSSTFNALGSELYQQLGRSRLWGDLSALQEFVKDNFDKAPFLSNALDDQEAAASQAALWGVSGFLCSGITC